MWGAVERDLHVLAPDHKRFEFRHFIRGDSVILVMLDPLSGVLC